MRPGPGGPEGWRHRAPLGRLGAAPLATHGAPSSRQGYELHELTPGRVSRSVRNGAGGGAAWGQRWGPAPSLSPRAWSALHHLQGPRPLAEPGPGASP